MVAAVMGWCTVTVATVMEAVLLTEAVRAALRGPIGAGAAADRLTQALGVPLPILRPRVTAAAVGHLVRAGLLSTSAATRSSPTSTWTRWPRSPAAGTCSPCSTGTSPWARTRPRAGSVSAERTST
ncbi:hypothetical protein AB0C77_22590 [Streptomyces sp. NPDC048629]|uniref:hypothetical protein n=1 Tax=Streptomyces sp. NPDC048629 TaxID=3154824 RepID=UPI003426D990